MGAAMCIHCMSCRWVRLYCTEYLELEIVSWRELKALSGPAAALRVGWSGVWLVIAQAAESIVFFYL
jgi:hypothetical protein